MQELVRAYQRDGVGVVKGAFSQEDVNRIRSAAFMTLTRLSDIPPMDIVILPWRPSTTDLALLQPYCFGQPWQALS